MPSFVFNIAKKRIAKGEITFDGNENLKLALVKDDLFTSSNIETSSTWTDEVDTFEIDVEGEYTNGGTELLEVEVTEPDEYGHVYVKCDDVTFGTNTTISAYGAVVYEDDGEGEDDGNLICAIDFGGNVSSSNGAYEINFDSTKGFLKLS